MRNIWIATLVLFGSALAACGGDEFDNCKATRTCPATGGGAGMFGGAGPVGISGSGGLTANPGGSSGIGGSEDPGAAGTAGSIGGESGAPGTGAAPLGTACIGSGECASGFCIDGVCCDTACEGPCKQCSANGTCDITPADDDACAVVDCPASTTCRTYGADLATNRCASFGQCKTSEYCSFENLSAGTKCGSADSKDICDGNGNCKSPTVSCGATGACSLSGSTTCCLTGASTVSCLPNDSSCGYETTSFTVNCDEPSDCPSGQVCCGELQAGGGFGYYTNSCKATCRQQVVCNPGAVPTGCSAGQACVRGTGVRSGYWFCQ